MTGGARAVFIFLFLALLSCHAAAGGGQKRHQRRGSAPSLPHPGGAVPRDTIFNVLNFGAKPGKADSTEGFMKAWNAACNFNGRSRLLIPKGVYQLGETLFQGPCKSKSITLYVAGTLQAIPDVSLYTGSGWISFDSVNDLIVTGGGTFHGQGQEVWQYNDCKTNPSCVHLPSSLYFNNMMNTKFMNVNLVNSMGFHMHLTNSFGFSAHGLKITSPEDSPNTDGIHVSKTNTVKISRSVIGTGDDCISIGHGSTNVTINKLTCGPGHGISVGSLGKKPKEMDVRGLIVKNCTLSGTTNGVRIKTYPASDPSKATGLLFSDIVMNNVDNPIIINQNYGSTSSKAPSRVKISDVVYQNIKGTTNTPIAVNLMCSPSVPCSNVRLSNVNLKFMGKSRLSSSCTNAQVSSSGIVIPPACP